VSDKPEEVRGSMSASTRLLHETLLRLVKGIVAAWEVWLSKQQ
jgi:hypothetical protein